jgi:ABC-type transporter Mla MlaB component
LVFSFFKKDSKDRKSSSGRDGAKRTPPSTGGRDDDARSGGGRPPLPLSPKSGPRFATTENAIPERELARNLAMATAAKIDAIESEMARDFLRPPGSGRTATASNTGGAQPDAVATTEAPKTTANAAAIAAANARHNAAEEELELTSDMLLGSAHAIELGSNDSASVIDEAAILFANRQDDAAEAVLRSAIEADQLGVASEHAWLMLFELIQQRGDKAGFEKLTLQYALRFEHSAPAWLDYAEPAAPAAAAQLAPVTRLPEVVDAGIVRPLEQLKSLAMTHAALTMDVSATRSIDLVGAELLLRVVNAFKRSAHELTLLGAEQLLTPLRAIVEPGRRDATDAGWMLLLEVQRLLLRQGDFEETGIQYCITFEVSPPSWEPPPHNLKVGAAGSVQVATPLAPAPAVGSANLLPTDPLDWRGEIAGEGEALFARMNSAARGQTRLAIECLHLRRMAFAAASALFSQLIKLQQGGVSVEFRDVNYLVGALMQLLGAGTVATIRLRRN